MVTASSIPAYGVGLYTPQEAALYAKLRTETFNRWFYMTKRDQPVLTPRFGDSRVVSFWDLIQAVSVRQLRQNPKASRITLQHIRSIVDECVAMGITYPLARNHTLYVFGNRLILRTDDGQFVGLKKGEDKGQFYEGKIIQPFLTEIKFDDSRLARVWTPLRSQKYRIDLDSERRFGLPVVQPGAILVSSLVDAVESEGSIEAAAEAYETGVEAVTLALKYQDYLAPAA